MLIQKMLNRHNINEYYLADYASLNGCGMISLLRHVDNQFYDVNNQCNVKYYDVKYMRNLTDYVECDKQFISDSKAQKLVEPYYDEFYNDLIEISNQSQAYKSIINTELV